MGLAQECPVCLVYPRWEEPGGLCPLFRDPPVAAKRPARRPAKRNANRKPEVDGGSHNATQALSSYRTGHAGWPVTGPCIRHERLWGKLSITAAGKPEQDAA